VKRTATHSHASASGALEQLHRWPVKSMGGEALSEARLDERGIAGDRAHAIFDQFKGAPRRLTAREAPRLLAWRASYPEAAGAMLDPEAPPRPVVTAPDGRRFRWDDPALPEALGEDLARRVELRRDVEGQQDLRRSVLITVEATRRSVEKALGQTLDLRRFRTNLHLELDAPPFAEEGWQGRRLTVGEAEFELLHPCARCVIPTRDPDTQDKWAELLRWLTRERGGLFGINARPLGPAATSVGHIARVG
jgi:uncharacterized protein